MHKEYDEKPLCSLVDEGEEDPTLLGPLVTEELDELGLTLSCPLEHLKSSNNVESNTEGSETSEDVETEPGHDLAEIVRASDVLEETTVRDDKSVRALGTHVLETHVADEVENHETTEPGEANKKMPGRKIRLPRNVHIPSNGSSEAPIVSTILEEVENGHGECAELMHENSLKQTLGVVNHPKQECNLLIDVQRDASLLTIHREKTHGEKDVDQPGASILKNVNRAEGNLRTKILEVDNNLINLTGKNIILKILTKVV